MYYKTIFIYVIDFRGYTVRRKWGPELEARVRRVLETYHNPDTAKKALQVSTQTFSSHITAINARVTVITYSLSLTYGIMQS